MPKASNQAGLNTENQATDLSQSLHFGKWQFDPALNQLASAEQTIHLEPKTAALLHYLLNHPNAVLSRDQLLAELWPGVIVSDDSLTQLVIKLRKALGDDSRKPEYIQTIPKRGYRFLQQTMPNTPSGQIRWVPAGWFSVAAIAFSFLLVFAVYWGVTGRQQPETSSGPTSQKSQLRDAEKLSLMVMPFEAMGEGEKQISFANSISAEITSDLSKLSGLWVISAEPLNAATQSDIADTHYIVSGKVQRTANHLDVYVQLTDSETNHQLWSERFKRPVSEIFDVQANISKQVVKTLEIQLSDAELRRLTQPYTQDLKAYELFLEGQRQLLVRQQRQNELAREHYWKAIERDPVFARAYAGLALSYAADYRNQWSEDGATSLDRAKQLAETALEINSEMPESHWVLGYVYAQRRQHDIAITHLETALNLDHSYADAYALLGGIYTYIGRPEETIKQLRNAMRLNPGAGALYFLLLGRAYFFLDDIEQAMVNLNESLNRNAALLETHIYIAASLVKTGDIESAEWTEMEIDALDSEFSAKNWIRTYPMTSEEQIKQLISLLSRLDI